MERDGSANLLDVLDELLQLPAGQRKAGIATAGLSDEDALRVRHWLAQQERVTGFLDAPPPLARDAMGLLDNAETGRVDRENGAPSGGSDAVMKTLLVALDATDAAGDQDTEPSAGQEGAGTRIGRYKLVRQIGEGGFGVVFLAEQEEPVRREVALKIIKLGMDTRQVVARFEAERQSLALMDHPDVAKVLDGGSTDSGRPYFVMELVPGSPITAYCDEHRLSVPDRLGLFLQVCHAVQHAHTKGIIHRDLKPTNILVHQNDDGRRTIKVIDFGIARALGGGLASSTVATEAGVLLGTPEYMSPEQATSGAARIDTRSDVYALGVILYELLCGRLPISSRDLRSSSKTLQQMICDVEPPSPSRAWAADRAGLSHAAAARAVSSGELVATLRRELEWIPRKALRKKPDERYGSVAELDRDVRCYLEGLPLHAARQTRRYRLRKFVARHRVRMALATVAALSLVFGLVFSSILLRRSRSAEASAHANERTALVSAGMLRIQQGNALIGQGRFGQARDLLGTAHAELTRLGGEAWLADIGLWDLARQAALPMFEQAVAKSAIVGAAFLPDGHSAIILSQDGTVQRIDLRYGRVECRHRVKDALWRTLKLTGDGKKAFLCDIWDGFFEWSLGSEPPRFRRGDVGTLIAVDQTGANTLHAYDGGVALCPADLTHKKVSFYPRVGTATDGSFLQDGTFVTCGKDGSNVCRWAPLNTGGPLISVDAGADCRKMVLSPNGRSAAVSNENLVRICDLETGTVMQTLRGHAEYIDGLAWSPGNPGRLYSCSRDGACRAWDLASGESRAFCGPGQPLGAITVSPDGKRLLAGAWDGGIQAWSTHSAPAAINYIHPENTKWEMSAALACDDDMLAVGEATTPAVLYDCRTGITLGDLGPQSRTSGLIRGATQTELAYGCFDGRVVILDLPTLAPSATLGELVTDRELQVYCWRARDVPRMLVWRRDADLSVWDLTTRKLVRTLSAGDLSWQVNFSPDGRLAVAFHSDAANGMELFTVDVKEGSVRQPSRGTLDGSTASAFSGDGQFLLVRHNHDESFGSVFRTSDLSFVRNVPDGNGVIDTDEFWPDDGHLLSTLFFGDVLLRDAKTGGIQYVLRDLGTVMAISGTRYLITKHGAERRVTICDLQWPARRREQEATAKGAMGRLASGGTDPADLLALGRWFALHAEDDWALDFFNRARIAGAAVDPLEVATSYARSGDSARAVVEYEHALQAPGNSASRATYLRYCLRHHQAVTAAGR